MTDRLRAARARALERAGVAAALTEAGPELRGRVGRHGAPALHPALRLGQER